MGGDRLSRGGEISLASSIATTGLAKAYGTTRALSGVDLQVPTGALYGLIGPSGAGKTTLLEILAGLRHQTSGEVHLEAPRSALAYCPDVAEFEPWLIAAEEVVNMRRTRARVSRGWRRCGPTVKHKEAMPDDRSRLAEPGRQLATRGHHGLRHLGDA
ncbi:MAG: ATP-binding cassette domain-containing protein [Candidatus Dormibacteria bacterium]